MDACQCRTLDPRFQDQLIQLLLGSSCGTGSRYSSFVLFSRRERLRTLAEREAAGESFWTTRFSEPVRVKIQFAFDDRAGQSWEAAEIARGLILREEGIAFLQDRRFETTVDLAAHLMKCDDSFVPTIIEAMLIGVKERPYAPWGIDKSFTDAIREILREHRIRYDFISGQIVPLESLELHDGVVVPTLTLLAGRKGLDGAEKAYLAALQEISDGNPSDAITDAGTALQETLQALGCDGNALGPLIKSARAKNMLASHDKALTDGIEKIAHWVSADRSENGDSHKVVGATIDDAWLTLHVVGALILRLSEATNRGK
jgi:hypothetical protein